MAQGYAQPGLEGQPARAYNADVHFVQSFNIPREGPLIMSVTRLPLLGVSMVRVIGHQRAWQAGASIVVLDVVVSVILVGVSG